MYFSCLKPRSICKSRRCNNVASVPEILKCAVCASWAESKGLASFSICFCKQKQYGDSRALLAELKKELEKYIGKLGTTIVDSKIQVAANLMFQTTGTKEASEGFHESSHGPKFLPSAPTFNSETGLQVLCQEENVCSMISESSIYLMQNLRIGNSNYLTFFDSGANSHLIDGQLAEKESLHLISSNPTDLGVFGGGSIMTEHGNFRFNLGPGEDKNYHEITAVGMRNVTAGSGKYNLEEIGQESDLQQTLLR